jgi:hypothetical protein
MSVATDLSVWNEPQTRVLNLMRALDAYSVDARERKLQR